MLLLLSSAEVAFVHLMIGGAFLRLMVADDEDTEERSKVDCAEKKFSVLLSKVD